MISKLLLQRIFLMFFSLALLLTGAKNVSAYMLTTSVDGGNGTISPPSGEVTDGFPMSLKATPAAGYRVKTWAGTDDDSLTSITNIVTMSSDKAVTVSFEEIPGGEWQAEYGTTGANASDTAYDAVFDMNGQVIAVGYDTTDSDGVALRFDTAGSQITNGWPIRYFPGSGDGSTDYFFGVAVDNRNHTIMVGRYYQAPNYYFIVRDYDEFGTYINGSFTDMGVWNGGKSVCIDSVDNIFAVGYKFSGHSMNAYYDWVIRKFAPNVSHVKDSFYDHSSSHFQQRDYANDVACDANDEVVVVGQVGISGNAPENADHDWHIRKYPNDLDNDDVAVGDQAIWSYTYRPSGDFGNGSHTDIANAVAIDSNNDVFIGGYVNLGTDNSASNADYRGVVIKLDGNTGAMIGSPAFFAEGSNSAVNGIGVDSQDNIYAAGYKNTGSGNFWHMEVFDKDLNRKMSKSWTGTEGVIQRINAKDDKVVLSGYYDNRAEGAADPDNDWKIMVLEPSEGFPWSQYLPAIFNGSKQ